MSCGASVANYHDCGMVTQKWYGQHAHRVSRGIKRQASVLHLQQHALCFQASCKSCQAVVAAYDAIAGDEDADAVCPNSPCHGSDGLGTPDGLRNILVTPCFSVGDAE